MKIVSFLDTSADRTHFASAAASYMRKPLEEEMSR